MTTIAQTYIHLKPFNLRNIDREQFFARLEEANKVAARAVYGRGITIEVYFEEGSLREWINVKGALLGAVAVVGTYGDVMQGGEIMWQQMRYLVRQARQFGDYVIQKTNADTEVGPSKNFHSERRTVTPGRIIRSVGRIRRLQKNLHELSSSAIEVELERIAKDLERAGRDIDSDEDKLAVLKPLKELCSKTEVTRELPSLVSGDKTSALPSEQLSHFSARRQKSPNAPLGLPIHHQDYLPVFRESAKRESEEGFVEEEFESRIKRRRILIVE